MRALFLVLLLTFSVALVTRTHAAGDELPTLPGLYMKLRDGGYAWLPPLSYSTHNLRLVDPVTGEALPYRRGPRLQSTLFGIDHVLLAPTVELAQIEHILVHRLDEKLRFVFSVAFADDYTMGRDLIFRVADGNYSYDEGALNENIRGVLAVTKWGYAANRFELRYTPDGSRRYFAASPDLYFANYTRPLSGDRRIIEVGRAIATDKGIYLFNTSASLSNLLWNVRMRGRQDYIPQMPSLLERLEQRASRFNEWGTVAWTYRDFGEKERAVAIYRDKVMPQTVNFDERDRGKWLRYFEEIQK